MPDRLASNWEATQEHGPEPYPCAEAPEELAAGLAHDLRNLLAAIGLFSDLLLRTPPLSPVQERYAKEISLTAKRGMDLVRQFMPGTRRAAPLTFCAVRMLQEMRPLLERLAGDRVKLEIETHAAKALIHADPQQIERVILNLAVNARDAMPQGGQLRFEISALEMADAGASGGSRLGTRLGQGSYVAITVADTGCGMDQVTLASALRPFYTTKASGGVGLGLAIVHSIMARNGGSVTLDSAPGQGTSVRIVLPAAVSSVEVAPRDQG